MPPKVKTELQVFSLDNLNPALLPELSTFKESQLKVVEDNPFVTIIDATTRDLAKKHRTARVSARTSLQAQDKLISSKFNAAKDKAKGYIAELIAYTQPGEIEQQKEIDRDEAEAEFKRQEKARLEQNRIDNIKKEIDNYYSTWNNCITNMTFESIDNVCGDFLESYTSFDTTILEEFEALFPTKVAEIIRSLDDKIITLRNAEIIRLENIRIEEEKVKFAKEKAEFEAEKEAKAKADKVIEDKRIADQKVIDDANEQTRKDLELVKQQLEENQAKLDIANKLLEKNIPKKSEPVKISDPIEPTVNVCTGEVVGDGINHSGGLSKESIEHTIKSTYSQLEYVFSNPTWDSIENDFKTSGEKSYSKWLKSNYNVPTKL